MKQDFFEAAFPETKSVSALNGLKVIWITSIPRA